MYNGKSSLYGDGYGIDLELEGSVVISPVKYPIISPFFIKWFV